MRIALAQMHMAATADDTATAVDRNLTRSIDLIERAAEAGASLVMFPEVQLSPFFPQYPRKRSPYGDASQFAMNIDGPQVHALRKACATYGIWASPNLYIEQKFYEQDYYAPGDGFHVFDTPLGRIGIVICFDRHYPESIRTSVLRGADLVLVPTANTLAEPLEMFDWEVRVQAFHNSAIVAMCNRCGAEDGMEFSGRSIIAGPDGSTVAQAGAGDELLLADVDLAGARAMRGSKPYTQLRRPRLYV